MQHPWLCMNVLQPFLAQVLQPGNPQAPLGVPEKVGSIDLAFSAGNGLDLQLKKTCESQAPTCLASPWRYQLPCKFSTMCLPSSETKATSSQAIRLFHTMLHQLTAKVVQREAVLLETLQSSLVIFFFSGATVGGQSCSHSLRMESISETVQRSGTNS